LLSQIETPEYLHSAVKGRSYITNAYDHGASVGAIKLDVQKFYPNARSAEVFRFLCEELLWRRDVAGLGKALLTCRGHLPTGGNASPLLSFWAYKPMFDALAQLAELNGCVFTVYVDDMTMTGQLACRRLLHQARQILGLWRLKGTSRITSRPVGLVWSQESRRQALAGNSLYAGKSSLLMPKSSCGSRLQMRSVLPF